MGINQTGTYIFALRIDPPHTSVEVCLLQWLNRGDQAFFHLDSVQTLSQLALSWIDDGCIRNIELFMRRLYPRLYLEVFKSASISYESPPPGTVRISLQGISYDWGIRKGFGVVKFVRHDDVKSDQQSWKEAAAAV
jgi:hypothetical protein